jgi:hypothetical protein
VFEWVGNAKDERIVVKSRRKLVLNVFKWSKSPKLRVNEGSTEVEAYVPSGVLFECRDTNEF